MTATAGRAYPSSGGAADEAVTPNPPAALPGAVTARLRDAPMLAAWQMRGWLYGATRGPARGRVVSVACAAVGVPTWPLLVALVAVQAASPRSRLYLSPERDAVLGVTATRAGWRLENHSTRRPGTGAGARFRALICPELLREADRHGVAIYLDAVTASIGSTYAEELPGLEDAGPALLRGRRMRRPCARGVVMASTRARGTTKKERSPRATERH